MNTSSDKQLRWLRYRKSCDYYKRLHATLFPATKYLGLTCGTENRKRITLTAELSNGKTFAYVVPYMNQQRLLSIFRYQVVNGRRSSVPDLSAPMPDGKTLNLGNERIATLAVETRRFLPAAVRCCFLDNGTAHDRCLAYFNGQPPPVVNPEASRPGYR